MIPLDLPDFDASLPAEWLIRQGARPEPAPARVFGGGARVAFQPPHGEALLRFFEPLVSKVLGQAVYGSYSFGWVYPKGGFVASHLDREEVHWYCGIALEQDAPWVMEAAYGSEWKSMPTKVGQAVLMDGAKYAHRRPPYRGERAVSLVLSYDARSEVAARRLGSRNRQSLETDRKLAGEMGLDVDSLLGFRKRLLPHLISLPLGVEAMTALWERVRGRVWHYKEGTESHSHVYAPAASELLGVQLDIRDALAQAIGTDLVCCQPFGVLHRSRRAPYSRFALPIEDFIVAFPLTRGAAEWRVREQGGASIACPFGDGVLFEGWPMSIEFEPVGRDRADWAFLPYREIPNV